MVGLIVEKIAEVVEIKEENIIPSPTIGHEDKGQNKYVYGVGKVGDGVKLLLDPDKLLRDDILLMLTLGTRFRTVPTTALSRP